jgi:putative SOS response-associated peptidase YedK
MCGRYARRSDKQKIAEFFAVHGPVIPDFQDKALNTSPTMRLRLEFVSAVDESLQADSRQIASLPEACSHIR